MNKLIDLKSYGFNEILERESISFVEAEGIISIIGRVILDYGQKLKVITEFGEKWLQRPSQKDIQLAVGDWIVGKEDEYTNDEIHFIKLLTRKTKFSRMAAGIEVKEQIVATNVDVVFLVQSLNNDFNTRRLERYLVATWESGARPVVILTKSDLCENVHEKISIVNDIAYGVDVHALSSITGEGIDVINQYFKEGTTVALLGSSGTGKSTLVNLMMGSEVLRTNEIREFDSKGRHTTTHRQLMKLPQGGLILDTPGMRSLALWEADEGITKLFGDVEELVNDCRFGNCTHRVELGCAVKAALADGRLKKAHWESWLKLQSEKKHLDQKIMQKTREMEKAQNRSKQKKENKRTLIRREIEEI